MDISHKSAILESAVIHLVGNKNNDEDLALSKTEASLNDDISEVLINQFFSAFNNPEFYQFYHESELEMNEVYNYASKIFDNPDEIHEQSKNIATHLYRQTMHPQIKAGEFYTVYFRDCEINGETVDAIGLFKTENKDSFFKVYEDNDSFQLNLDSGINLNKLDKACLIFNTEREDGFIVSIIDKTSKGKEAIYWIDDFLYIQNRKDEFFQTKNVLTLCKNYVKEQMPEKFDVTKAEQADLLNKSMKFFKDKEIFDENMFAEEVMGNSDIIDDFKDYKSEFEKENNIEINNDFEISKSAVKKQEKFFKSVIKLDKNFHIYVHGKPNMIEKGFDNSNGMNYYKLYYEKED